MTAISATLRTMLPSGQVGDSFRQGQGADMEQTLIAVGQLVFLVAFVVVLIAGLLRLATQHRRW